MIQDKRKNVLKKVEALLHAYKQGALGDCTMPEDEHPDWSLVGDRRKLAYYTFPMCLNYQRNSYKLWEAAKSTFECEETRKCFSEESVATMSEDELRSKLLRFKLALQPNKHIDTWYRVAETISREWGDVQGLLDYCDNDFVELRRIVQKEHKKGFPYLSGPKIFHYWCFILEQYCGIKFTNAEQIEIGILRPVLAGNQL